jgi:hypothetical protein
VKYVARSIIDRRRFAVWLFFLDLVIWGVLIVCIVDMVNKALYANYFLDNGTLSLATDSFLKIARDAAIATGCGIYTAVRQFRNELQVLRRLL